MITIVLVVTMLLAMSVTGYAAENEEPPEKGIKMTYITSVYTSLSISSGGLSNSYADMTAYPGVDSVRISMHLQRYDNGWKTVQHWAQDFNGTMGSLSRNWYVTSGYNYRVLTYFYAYDGTQSESISRTHERSYY